MCVSAIATTHVSVDTHDIIPAEDMSRIGMIHIFRSYCNQFLVINSTQIEYGPILRTTTFWRLCMNVYTFEIAENILTALYIKMECVSSALMLQTHNLSCTHF